MRMFIDGFYMIKGPEEQLLQLEALIEKHGIDADTFSNEVAQLAIANDTEHWKPEMYKDYKYPAMISYSGITSHGVMEFDLESHIDSRYLTPEHTHVFGRMLDAAFPGIEANWLYRCSEEGEHGLFAKGGKSVNEFWSANYVAECEWDEIWSDTLEELIEAVENWTETADLRTFEDCVKTLETHCEKNDIDNLIVAEIPLLSTCQNKAI